MKCKASVRGSCQAPHPGVELAKAVAHPHEVVEPPRDGEVGVSRDELDPARRDVIAKRAAAPDAELHVLVEEPHAFARIRHVALDEPGTKLLPLRRTRRRGGVVAARRRKAAHALSVGAVVHRVSVARRKRPRRSFRRRRRLL